MHARESQMLNIMCVEHLACGVAFTIVFHPK